MPKHKSKAGAPSLDATVADLRALAHPLRLRMMELFAERERTTKQVAELLGQPPTRLYHHVAALERAGLLTLKSTRQNRGAVEKYYEAVSRRMASSSPGVKRGNRTGTAEKRALAMTILEQARQEMMTALSRAADQPALMARLVVSGSPKEVAEVRARLQRAVAEIQREFSCEPADASSAGGDAQERWAMTLAFAPVWPAAPTGPGAKRSGRK